MEWLERMKSAIDLIESKLTDKVDVEEIAKQAYSSSYPLSANVPLAYRSYTRRVHSQTEIHVGRAEIGHVVS